MELNKNHTDSLRRVIISLNGKKLMRARVKEAENEQKFS